MIAKLFSAALIGLDSDLVEVEADISFGLPSFTIVGLPDTAIQESRDRVRTALKNLGHSFPEYRVTVNLAPADIKKEGPAYDLPIALAVLQSDGKLKEEIFKESIFLGELSLEGKLRPITGALATAILAKENKIKNIFIPGQNAKEAGLINDSDIDMINKGKKNSYSSVGIGGGQIFPDDYRRYSFLITSLPLLSKKFINKVIDSKYLFNIFQSFPSFLIPFVKILVQVKAGFSFIFFNIIKNELYYLKSYIKNSKKLEYKR